jgi:hypothetical protein
MTTAAAPPTGGLYEHWYGTADLDAALRYWRQLGYDEAARGSLDADAAARLYGVRAPLQSLRLRHRSTDRQGLVRVLRFDGPCGTGLGFAHALALGSRWSGFYTRDILAVQDAYRDEAAATGAPWKVTELARLFISAATPGFYEPFVGIRESTVTGPEHRHAFLQRVGFDRPGFGSFAEGTPLPVCESTHGNIVIPDLAGHEFYAAGLGLAVQAPVQRIDWTMAAVRRSLAMEEGEAFSVIVYHTAGEPTGFLRVYAPHDPRPDLRAASRPGHRGNVGYTLRYPAGSLDARHAAVAAAGATHLTVVSANEFGERSFSFDAPDGTFWNLLEDPR